MRMRTIVTSAVAGAAGLTVAVTGYQQLLTPIADQTSTTTTAGTSSSLSATDAPAEVRNRFRDCPRGHVLKQRACVRVVERTVVVDLAAPAAPGTAAAATGPRVAPVAAATPSMSVDDDRGEDGRRDDVSGSNDVRDDHDDDHDGRFDDRDEGVDDRDDGVEEHDTDDDDHDGVDHDDEPEDGEHD